MKYVGDKVSYVKSPFVRNSYYCLVLVALSLALASTNMYLSVSRAGQGGLSTGALGLVSTMATLMGLWYGLPSFHEKERSYIPAKIGVDTGLVLLITWVIIIVTGLMR